MGKTLGRHHGTIARELKRNSQSNYRAERKPFIIKTCNQTKGADNFEFI
ncbi:helix-turn-helix domain-containing protein [Neobacillus niacini]